MNRLRFQLTISPEDYLAYYSGAAKTVSVTAEDGRRIEFPAEHLRKFVTHQGIVGYFEIEFDLDFRFQALRRIDNSS